MENRKLRWHIFLSFILKNVLIWVVARLVADLLMAKLPIYATWIDKGVGAVAIGASVVWTFRPIAESFMNKD